MSTPVLTLWQKNLVGAVVVAVAVAVIAVTDIVPHVSTYRAGVTPARVLAKGQETELAGQTWRLGAVHHLNAVPRAPAVTLPDRTTLLVVVLDRTGSPPAGECSAVLTDGRRRWPAQTLEFRVPPVDGATDRCDRPGRLQLTFLVPSDAAPSAVDLIGADAAIGLRILL